MKRVTTLSGLFLLLGMMVAMPLAAQEDPAAAFADAYEAPSEDAFADDAAGEGVSEDAFADAAPDSAADAAPVEDGADAFAADVPTETDADAFAAEAPADDGFAAAEEEVAVEEEAVVEDDSASAGSERDPVWLYVGADYAWLTAQFSSDALQARFGADRVDSRFYRGRIGTRLFQFIGVEGHFGVSDTDDSLPGDVEVSEYVGIYLVPTGVLFNLLEVSAPVGYSVTELQRGNASEKFDAVSFGLNIEIPLLVDVDGFPDIRIGGGGTVYQAEKESRVYGYHAGIRIDFNI